MSLLRRDPKCSVHGTRYPAGSSCAKCARNINPVTRQRASSGVTKAKSHAPYPCPNDCGQMVRGGHCPTDGCA
jgi:radical SAM superfamily enzyme